MLFVKPKTRWGASAIHLLISAVIFLVLAAVIVFVWYPGFLFKTDGGWQGIRLIAGVDLVLGPMLTFFVYKATKPSLKFDLSVIACIQLAALVYGSLLVYQERPVAVVYANGVIRTLAASSFSDESVPAALEAMERIGSLPAWVYVEPPNKASQDEEGGTLAILSKEGLIHTRYKSYQPFFEKISEIKQGALTPKEGSKYNDIIEQAGDNPVYELKARFAYGLIELDAETLDVVDLHNITYALQNI